MAFDPHTATLAVLTLGVGWIMTAAGLQKNALELRKRRRRCPSGVLRMMITASQT